MRRVHRPYVNSVMLNTDEHHNEAYEDGEPRTSSVATFAYPEWKDTSMGWNDDDFNSPDPFVRHNAHQAAKGRAPLPDPDVTRKAQKENGLTACERIRALRGDADSI
jgi:hypothetical protein